MNEVYELLQDFVRTSEAQIEKEEERLQSKKQELQAMDMLMSEMARLKRENESLKAQVEKQDATIDRLMAEADERDTEIKQLKMQLAELGKLSNKVVAKTEHDDLIKVLRTYMNNSKRKQARKRGYIKMVILEIVQAVQLELPTDMKEMLDTFDDEVPPQQQVNVDVKPGGINIQHVDCLDKVV